MRLIGYCRVSTDDKGQDPDRQKDVIQAWADREKHTVLGWVKDEGTSGAKDPFQRQAVLEAIEMCQDLKADGIVVEAVDRWTRGGPEAFFVSKFFLRTDHGDLGLVVANTPPGMTPPLAAMLDSIMATVAQMFRERLREQIKSGRERAERLGWPKGKPGSKPKPPLSPAEMEVIAQLAYGGHGVDRMSVELSRIRGANEVSDRKAKRRLEVRPTWLWLRIRSQMPELAGRMKARKGKGQPIIEVKNERMDGAA